MGNGSTYGFSLGDVDGDGDLDAVFANYLVNDLVHHQGIGEAQQLVKE